MKFYKHEEQIVSLENVTEVCIISGDTIRIIYTHFDRNGNNYVNWINAKDSKEAKQILEDIYNALNA